MDWKKLVSGENEAGWDRALRLFLAAALVAAFALNYAQGMLGYAALVVALILAVTALTGHCLIYSLLGFATRKE
jgi:hypothetical protein